MGKLIVGAFIGLVAGGFGTYMLFVGTPGGSAPPGEPIRPPDPGSQPAAAQVILPESLMNSVLEALMAGDRGPTFQLAADGREEGTRAQHASFQGAQCESRITLLPEGSGIRSAVAFENGRIKAPLAFTGAYNSFLGCVEFSGWAQTDLELRYDRGQQAVFGNVAVESVNLDGVNPVIGALITPVVQSTLNDRVNPLQILRGQQIALSVPIQATGRTLQASVTDVRAEVTEDDIRLHLFYDLGSQPVQ
jgi:hypothetical protein